MKPWRLIYATRNRQRAAFLESLAHHGPRAQFHFDDQRGAMLDVAQACRRAPRRAGLLLRAEGDDGRGRPHRAVAGGTVQFEWFTAPGDAAAGSDEFTVQLRSSGRRFSIPPDKSILEVLEASGLEVPFSCREGLCGTCVTAVCAGEPEHRDYVLSRRSGMPGSR